MPDWSQLNIAGADGRPCDGWRGSGVGHARVLDRPWSALATLPDGSTDRVVVAGEPMYHNGDGVPRGYPYAVEHVTVPAGTPQTTLDARGRAHTRVYERDTYRVEAHVCPYAFRYGAAYALVFDDVRTDVAVARLIGPPQGVTARQDEGEWPPKTRPDEEWLRLTEPPQLPGPYAGPLIGNLVESRGWCATWLPYPSPSRDTRGLCSWRHSVAALDLCGRQEALAARAAHTDHADSCPVGRARRDDPTFPDYDSLLHPRDDGWEPQYVDHLPDCNCTRARRRAAYLAGFRTMLYLRAVARKLAERDDR